MTSNEQFEGLPFLELKDSVYISGTVYLKSKDSEAMLPAILSQYGYELNEDKTYAKLNSFSQCLHCDGIIAPHATHTHGHVCELCGKPTYLEYNRDEYITFQFMRNGSYVGDNSIVMRIYDYDTEKKELLLFPEPITAPTAKMRRLPFFCVKDAQEAAALLDEAKDLYTMRSITENGITFEVMALKNQPSHAITAESVFNPSDITGTKSLTRDVYVYNGNIYPVFSFGEDDKLPIPDHFGFSNAYMENRLSLANPRAHEIIMSAAGQVSRCDYYHQDGRPAFGDVVYKRWRAFIEHCVDIPVEKWDSFIKTAPRDGPSFINALAKWCSSVSGTGPRAVRDDPNMGNALEAAFKQQAGIPLTEAEVAAAIDGLEDLAATFGQKVSPADLIGGNIYENVTTILDMAGSNRTLQKISGRKPNDP
jgi:hypothetical protein